MHLARRIAAIVLLALWLPALLHCRLEAAGLSLGAECCDRSHEATPSSDNDCDSDACGVAEGAFTAAHAPVLAAAPLLCASFFTADAFESPDALTAPPIVGVVECAAAPPEIGRCWVFVVRAALSPRAPALAS